MAGRRGSQYFAAGLENGGQYGRVAEKDKTCGKTQVIVGAAVEAWKDIRWKDGARSESVER